MPVNRRIRLEIDYQLIHAASRSQLYFHLDTLLEDLFDLLASTPDEAPATAAYLSYRLSSELMHSRNHSQQAELAEDLSVLLRVRYNDPNVLATLSAAPRPQAFAVLLRLYNIHLSLLINGLRSAEGPQRLDVFDALRLLRIAVTGAWGPWHGIVRLAGNIRDYYHSRVSDPGAGLQIALGRTATQDRAVDVRVATLNMQGSSETSNTKFRSYILPLARMHHVVALQEAGSRPLSSHHVARLFIDDQFGVQHEVNQYLWEAGSTARPERYQLYYLEVQRLRVNLALVVADDVDVRSVVVIADGVRRYSGALHPRPILGLRLRLRGAAQELTVFNFHATSGGGVNCPRMLREVAWHVDTRYVLLGDFNRDPGTPNRADPQAGNWISPPGIAQLVPAAGPTHPSHAPSQMLDYAVVNGSSGLPGAGLVGEIADSDHRSVSFTFHFPSD